MRQLLNTLFVTSEDIYLSLDGENVVANRGGEAVARYPLHTLQSIVSFSYAGASPALMGACAQREAEAPVTGRTRLKSAIRQCAWRGRGACAPRSILRCRPCRRSSFRRRDSSATGRPPRGTASAAARRSPAPDLLHGREISRAGSRTPPLDAFNALLSFAYSLLAHDCASALESVGLDAYVGYLHRDRPGRESLALDLMEELRPCFADRFVLTLINNRVLKAIDFDFRESGAVLLTDTGRRTFLQKWQERKKETITHPFLEEKIPWGLVPYVQSLLLARYLRGDLDDYPPFLWK